jgi:hypothetical protein
MAFSGLLFSGLNISELSLEIYLIVVKVVVEKSKQKRNKTFSIKGAFKGSKKLIHSLSLSR